MLRDQMHAAPTEEPKVKQKEKVKHLFFPSVQNFKYLYKKLRKCKHFLLLCIYQISHKKLVKILIELANQGRTVAIILDHKELNLKQSSLLSKLFHLSNHTIRISINDEPEKLMHSKFWVVDGKYVGLGSANWTYQAFLKNHEHVTLLRSKSSSEQFITQFETLWNQFKQLTLQNGTCVVIDPNHPQFAQPFEQKQKLIQKTRPFQLEEQEQSEIVEISKNQYENDR